MPKLRNLKIGEVSFCKDGMNPHAKVALFKSRDGSKSGPPAIVKKTFEQALNAQLVSEQVSETFWRAFENQWVVREAFRIALTDEIAEGGDGSEATDGFVQAMQDLASSAANAARNAASTAETDLEAAVEEAVSKFLLQHQEQPMKITNKAQLQKAVAEFDASTSPFAHVGIIQKAAADLDAEDELPAEGPLAKAAPDETKTELAKAKRDIAVLKMDDATRTHFEGLDETAQTAFLGKSKADQEAEVAKANEADPVLYTTTGGTAIRKSDGAAVLALAKSNDEKDAQIAELQKSQTEGTIEQRATSEFPNVAKSVAVDMLKSVAAVGADTDTGKSIMKSLTALNSNSKGLFKSQGTTEAPDQPESVQKSRSDFNTEVQKAVREGTLTQAEAMSKVRDEQPELYAAAFPDSAPADEDA